MRVLMTGDTVGGVWTYALALADGLGRRGIEVHLATMGRLPTPAQRAQAGRIDGLVLHASDYRLCWMPEPWDDLERAARWLTRLARELRPDLIHLNDFGHAGLPWEAPVLLVGHSCVLSWWRAVHGVEAPPEWQRYRRLVGPGVRRADLVVAPTVAMGEALERHYGPIADLRVIPNGLAGPKDAGTVTKAPIILSAGRLWDEAKNIRALASIAGDLPWPVVIAGDGAGSVAEPGFANCILTGSLAPAELDAQYAAASIFAMPARYEPFGLAALEAAAHRCALVLGDIPSLHEVWGTAALFVPPDDPAALRETLLGLVADPAACRDWGERAALRARSFGLGPMTEGYVRAYQGLVEPIAA
jgi:glycogen synthase